MDRLRKNKKILLDYLEHFLDISNDAESNLLTQLVKDEELNTYIVLTFGWTPERFIHFVVFHFEIKSDGKIWLYQNRTNKSVIEELGDLGITSSDIVPALVEPYYLEELVDLE